MDYIYPICRVVIFGTIFKINDGSGWNVIRKTHSFDLLNTLFGVHVWARIHAPTCLFSMSKVFYFVRKSEKIFRGISSAPFRSEFSCLPSLK